MINIGSNKLNNLEMQLLILNPVHAKQNSVKHDGDNSWNNDSHCQVRNEHVHAGWCQVKWGDKWVQPQAA